MFGGLGAGFFVVPDFFLVENPGGVEAEVDADVAVLLEGGVVEFGAEGEELYGFGAALPEAVEACERRVRRSRAATSFRTRRQYLRGGYPWLRRRRFR